MPATRTYHGSTPARGAVLAKLAMLIDRPKLHRTYRATSADLASDTELDHAEILASMSTLAKEGLLDFSLNTLGGYRFTFTPKGLDALKDVRQVLSWLDTAIPLLPPRDAKTRALAHRRNIELHTASARSVTFFRGRNVLVDTGKRAPKAGTPILIFGGTVTIHSPIPNMPTFTYITDRHGNRNFVPVWGTVIARLAHGPHDVKSSALSVLDILANGAPRTRLGRIIIGKVAAKAGLEYKEAAKAVAELRDRGMIALDEQTLGGYRVTLSPKGQKLAAARNHRLPLAA